MTFLAAVIDYDCMQRLSDILSRTYRGFAKIIRIRTLWPEIAGEVLTAHTEPVQLKGKTLSVLCDSPAWVQQMGVLGPALADKVRTVARIKVERIDARFSAQGRPVSRRDAARRPVVIRFDIDPEDIKRIKDPRLRKAMMGLID